jgi:glycosyltransferase involved in cell wall biosynthesis
MKFLVISNLYPPCYLGGYEIGASWVCRGLKERGHQVAVLTCSQLFHAKGGICAKSAHADWGDNGGMFIDAGTCFYGLDVLGGLLLGGYGAEFSEARSALDRHFEGYSQRRRDRKRQMLAFDPDVILLFNPACMLDPVLSEITRIPQLSARPLIAYVSDDWLIRWSRSNPLIYLHDFFRENAGKSRNSLVPGRRRLLEQCRKWEGEGIFNFLEEPHIDKRIFCSESLRKRYAGAKPQSAEGFVVPWGVPAALGYPVVPSEAFFGGEPLTLAYAGQIESHKGLYDLLRALLRTKRAHRLLVCGDPNTEYARLCQKFLQNSELNSRIEFLGRLAPEKVWPALTGRAQVFVLPSHSILGHFQEPFSIALVEAMSCGMAVIASDSGGSPEAIVDGQSGLLYPAGAAEALGERIDRLESERAMASRLGDAARSRVRYHLSIERMIGEIVQVAASPVASKFKAENDPLPIHRGSIFYLLRNATRDPANSGCVRVARRLGRELQASVRPWFTRWDEASGGVVFLDEGEAEYLGRFNGPNQGDASEPGRTEGTKVPVHQSRECADLLPGAWLILPELLDAAVLDAVVTYARSHRMLVAAIFYDAIPVLRPDLCNEEIVENHAAYMTALAKCDLVMAISQFSGDCLQDYWRGKGVTAPQVRAVLLPGEFTGSGQAASERTSAVNILCVSTLEPRKNHRSLLAAMEIVARRVPDLKWKLHLVGNAYAGAVDISESVEAAMRRDPRVVWHRIVDDRTLSQLYDAAAFTIYPSIIEGFGLPILESLWHGRPCICSNAGVMAELAAGGGCLTVDVENPEKLAEAIVRLSTDAALASRLSSEAAGRVLKTWRQYADEFRGVLEEHQRHEEPETPVVPEVDDLLYPKCLHAAGWQMAHAERMALTGLLHRIRPKCSIEVGTYKAGSLSLIRQFSPVVFSVDIDPTVAAAYSHMQNVSFLTGASSRVLPVLLRELEDEQIPVDFILIDGDHSRAGIAADLRAVLAHRPLGTLFVLMHDSFNPECRAGMLEVPWGECAYVHRVELDFVPGLVVNQPGAPFDGQMWGGLALAVLARAPRPDGLVVSQSAQRSFEYCQRQANAR